MTSSNTIKKIYLQIRTKLMNDTVLRSLVPPHEVEDIVQESYIRLCGVTHQSDIQNTRSYLVRTVRNLAIDYSKRASSRLNTRLEEEHLHGLSEYAHRDETYAQATSDEEFSLFCEAVRTLPVQCRRVFVLKRVYGYSQREIARELGITESAVEKHVALGIRRCSDYMSEHEVAFDRGMDKTPARRFGGADSHE